MLFPELVEWCASVGDAEPEVLQLAKEQAALHATMRAESPIFCYPQRRARQVWRWMYSDSPSYGGSLYMSTFDETEGLQNGFSARFREAVRGRGTPDGGLELLEAHDASDGTTKLVFRVTAGEAAGGRVETVLIPVVR